MLVQDYLKKILGMETTEKTEGISVISDLLPFYIKESYTFSVLYIYEKRFLLAKPNNQNYVTRIKKDINAIESATGHKCIFLPDSLSAKRRQFLIDNKIQFIVDGKQIYLPFLGISLEEKFEKKLTEIDKFAPATQLVFLFLVYHGDYSLQNGQSVLCDDLGLDKMTVSRSLKELVSVGLLAEEKKGNKSVYTRKFEKRGLLERCEKYLINPIKRVAIYDREQVPQILRYSGIYALAKKTDLSNLDKDLRYAGYYKKTPDSNYNYFRVYDGGTEDDLKYATVELWRYNPALLSQTDTVDDISLYLTLRDEKDERVQKALAELIEEYK